MPDPTATPGAAATPTPAKPANETPAADPKDTLLSSAGQEENGAGDGTVLDDAAKLAKEQQEAEEKRLLDADDSTLSAEDKAKKDEIVKAKTEAKAKADADAKAKQVPDKYEFKVPEGMTLDTTLVDKVSPLFKELKLSQADAQKLADIYIEQQKAMVDVQSAAFQKFLKDSKDETIKALGANYKADLAYVAKVRDRFLSQETREMLDASGLSNNKALILDLIKIGKLISEDKLVSGRPAGAAAERSRAEIMYPSAEKK